jgi:hypothetical protein
MVLAALLYAPFQAPAADNAITVDVYMDSCNALWQAMFAARARVAGIFSQIGITLNWRAGMRVQPAANRPAVAIGWSRAPASVAPGALAAAHPFGNSITLYEDRLTEFLKKYRDAESIPFAYILAHEMAHVFEGIDRHSASGILKDQWSIADYCKMRSGKLTFTDEDIELIRRGLAGWVAGPQSFRARNAREG